MSPRPLCEIRPRVRDHLSALWWLGLLYRRPTAFRDALTTCPRTSIKLNVAVWLYLHAIPYGILLSVSGQLLLYGVLDWPRDPFLVDASYGPGFHLSQSAAGIVAGIIGGIVLGIILGIICGITFRGAFGIDGGIAIGVAAAIALGTGMGMDLGIIFGIGEGIALGIVGRIALALVVRFDEINPVVMSSAMSLFGIGIGIFFAAASDIGLGIGWGFGFGIVFPRTFYHAVHPLFLWPRPKARWYPYHPAAWDDLCGIPFPGLGRLLVSYAEMEPEAGAREIERLITGYPAQKREALRARVTLLAREAGRLGDLTLLGRIASRLPEGEEGFLNETRRLGEMVEEIVRLQVRLNAVDRPIFREPIAELLCKEVENFQHRVKGFHEPLASEFRAASGRWLELARRQREAARSVVEREPTPQVFRAGDPVDREQEAFVPRYSVLGELERQVLLSTGCPGLILYGRRRMGKSTVLRNLAGILPPTVRPVTVSMQNPEASASLASLINHLQDQVRQVMPELPTVLGTGVFVAGRFMLGTYEGSGWSPDLPGLFRFLAACNEILGAERRRLLLALDEYESIDIKIGEGVFPEDLLATVRESIQTHRNLTWAFAGSHEITELRHAPWTSYLVSARTVEVPAFTDKETRLLLTEPLKSSTLWPDDANGRPRPRFEPEFWGEGGIERIHAEAGGWPHLVQLIAETIVDLLNDEGGRRVDDALRERALDRAIVRGDTVLYQLVRGECTLSGEWDYVSAFRNRETQPPPGDEAVARSLRHRLLIEEDGGGWRLRVPLMRRWLRRRG